MQSLQFRLDLRYVCLALVAIIITMLALWRPWQSGAVEKTITVTGEATVERAPDAFVFSPTYQSEGTDSAEALSKVNAIGNEVVANLKRLGVADNQITTQVSSNANDKISQPPEGRPLPAVSAAGATYGITAKVKDKALAQKVLGYLTQTPLQGSLTPYSEFSKQARAELELEARSKAIENARAKTDLTAKELGVKLGKVVKVDEEGSRAFPVLEERAAPSTDRADIQPPVLETGLQEISFNLKVVFQIN